MIMRISWIGRYTGNNLPAVNIEANAKPFPEVTAKAALLIIPVCALFALFAYGKYQFLGGLAFSRRNWMIGILLALLFTPVHELLHALCFPRKSQVFLFYTMQGFGITCTSPITRSRFIVVNLLPSLILGFVPFVLFMIVPHTYEFASTVLCVFSLVHLGCGYVDYLNIIHSLKIPGNAIVQISGADIFWYEPASIKTFMR